jgi:hypothetical protein
MWHVIVVWEMCYIYFIFSSSVQLVFSVRWDKSAIKGTGYGLDD